MSPIGPALSMEADELAEYDQFCDHYCAIERQMLTIRATTLAGVIAQVDLLDELAAFHPDCDDEDCQPLLEIIRTGLGELLGHAP